MILGELPFASHMKPHLLLLGLGLLATSCSIKRIAIDSFASSLSEGTDVFATEDDPELVRDALPFALKAVDALLEASPENSNLLLTACRGYTQYAYAFVLLEAERIEERVDYDEGQRQRQRALKLFLRARDFGLRGLELEHEGITERLLKTHGAAAEEIDADEVPFLYWTASAWGAAIGQGLDQPELLSEISVARSLMERALELDESWDSGAIHEAMVTIECFPESMGGSPERALEHFRRAEELSGGQASSLYVTLAEKLCIPSQDRAQFESLLQRALEVDLDAAPERRLANTINQERARFLLSLTDDLFL